LFFIGAPCIVGLVGKMFIYLNGLRHFAFWISCAKVVVFVFVLAWNRPSGYIQSPWPGHLRPWSYGINCSQPLVHLVSWPIVFLEADFCFVVACPGSIFRIFLDSTTPLPFGRICFVVLVMRKGGESSWSGPWHLGSFVFHVHSYQDQFIQPGWDECVLY